MNCSITGEIERLCSASVSYQIADGVTAYTVTKPVDGKSQSVQVRVTADSHASLPASDVAAKVSVRAHELFAEMRQEKKDQQEAK